MTKLTLSILLVLLSLHSVAKISTNEVADSLQFEKNFRLAQKSFDSVLYYLKLANQFATNDEQETRTLIKIARHYYDSRELDSAQLVLSELFEEYEPRLEKLNNSSKLNLFDAYFLQDYIHKINADYDAGNRVLQRAEEILQKVPDNKFQLADIYNSKGVNYQRKGDYRNAIQFFKKVITIAVNLEALELQIKGYGNIGLSYINLHETSLAKKYYQLILYTINSKEVPKETIFRYLSHNNIGLVYEAENNHDSALFHYNKALDVLDAIPSSISKTVTEGTVTSNIALLLYKAGRFEEATKASKTGLKRLKEVFGDSHTNLVRPLRVSGDIYSMLGNFEKAQQNQRQALEISKSLNYEIPSSYYHLADLFYLKEEYDMASIYYDSSLYNNQVISLDTLYKDYAAYFYALRGKVRIELQENNPNSQAVLSFYQKFKSNLFQVVKDYENKTLRSDLIESLEDYYIFFSNQYNQDSSIFWLERLWEISELNKALKLKGHLKNEYALTYSLPDSVLSKEKDLKMKIDDRLRSLNSSATDSSLLELHVEYQAFIKQIEKSYPEYYRLKNSFDLISFKDVKDDLKSDMVVLNFFEGVRGIYLLQVGKEKTIKSRFDKLLISEKVQTLQQAILDNRKETFRDVSRSILKEIKYDGFADINTIVIIPDGIVWKLDFTSLLMNNTTFPSVVKEIRYEYFFRKESNESPSLGKVLAFSYDIDPSTSIFSKKDVPRNNLVGSSDEITSISKLFKGNFLYGEDATELNFKNKSSENSIIHLAVHGYQNEYFPENSYLQFYSSDSLDDGKLHTYELYNVQIKSKLAVLSACNSGNGKLEAGEGVVSLAHAFAYAGTESIVASRWEVPDYSAPLIMKYFYGGLKDGMRKSEALKYAQNKYLQNDADNLTSSPFYWAGFYVIGDDSPVVQVVNQRLYYSLILILALGLLVYWGYSRRSIKSAAS